MGLGQRHYIKHVKYGNKGCYQNHYLEIALLNFWSDMIVLKTSVSKCEKFKSVFLYLIMDHFLTDLNTSQE